MLAIYEAAWEMHTYLTKQKIPYVVIGGIAVQKWGQPRLTKDVDLTISVPVEKTEAFVKKVAVRFKPRVAELREFARRTRVLPIYAGNGCMIDVSLALPGYEDLLMQRAILQTGSAQNHSRLFRRGSHHSQSRRRAAAGLVRFAKRHLSQCGETRPHLYSFVAERVLPYIRSR